ncbi:ribokinase [Pseudolysinimonas yzui]|uniref:Ribokinase n=1 Tax=Pseudolysinimonas yzui TaxID=2708254 RepID=A0A8J3M067_9MICO|nr:ribokinase [Pseudolysinimonas yzui]GHF13166.1 ribokinase [Pseudolysinimonas yzui]
MSIVADIVVLGSANVDLVVRQPRLPVPGETVAGADFTRVPGGKGLNQAIAAARSGATVAFLGAVGRDELGDSLRRTLRDDGIDTRGLTETDVSTGIAVVSVLDGGENAITVVPGANGAVRTLDDESRAAITRARFLVAQFERPIPLVAQAFEFARGLGIPTVLTPAPVTPLGGDVLALADILVPNAQEACELAGTPDEEVAARELSRGGATVVMTRGGRGVLVAKDGAVTIAVPAREVDPVDTTAAGDTLAGFLIGRLALGDELESALRAAVIAASLAVTRRGASSSIPFWPEVEQLL